MSARELMLIDVQVEVSIVGRSQVSVDEIELMSIDTVCLSLQIERSKCAGSENKSDFFFLVASGTDRHLPENLRKKNS